MLFGNPGMPSAFRPKHAIELAHAVTTRNRPYAGDDAGVVVDIQCFTLRRHGLL